MGVARELFVTDNFDRADVCGFPIRITAVENGGGGAFRNRLHDRMQLHVNGSVCYQIYYISNFDASYGVRDAGNAGKKHGHNVACNNL